MGFNDMVLFLLRSAFAKNQFLGSHLIDSRPKGDSSFIKSLAHEISNMNIMFDMRKT